MLLRGFCETLQRYGSMIIPLIAADKSPTGQEQSTIVTTLQVSTPSLFRGNICLEQIVYKEVEVETSRVSTTTPQSLSFF